jgi:D-serine deaminase-like pyridoxal phosphate-dependent protein
LRPAGAPAFEKGLRFAGPFVFEGSLYPTANAGAAFSRRRKKESRRDVLVQQFRGSSFSRSREKGGPRVSEDRMRASRQEKSARGARFIFEMKAAD